MIRSVEAIHYFSAILILSNEDDMHQYRTKRFLF